MKVFLLTVFMSVLMTNCNSWEENPLVDSAVTAHLSDHTAAAAAVAAVGNARSLLENTDDKRLFYIYDLHESYAWRWPNESADCSKNKYIKANYGQLSGIGPSLNATEGLFLTWHFSLFSSLYNRFKRSSRRTRDPEKASLFIIPYDLALDGYVDTQTCANRNPPRCTNRFVPHLMHMLGKNKYWKKYQGADHAVLWSLHEHHQYPTKGCDTFIRTFCTKCIFTTYFMNHTKEDNHFISVPFPSGYHWQDEVTSLPWDTKNAGDRHMTAVYIGSMRTITPAHTNIRIEMTSQCKTAKNCHWLKVFHSATDSRIGDLLSSYKKAVFCLCPPGDDPGRKAVFDSIVAGCIPVIFHESTIYNQYPWHIGEQTALDVSVFIPGDMLVGRKVDLMAVLSAISPETIRKKQAALALLAPRVQYSVPPMSMLRNRSDESVWDSPFRDAADLTLDGMFDRVARVVKKQRTGIPRVLLSDREWKQRYRAIRVQVPGEASGV